MSVAETIQHQMRKEVVMT